MIFSPTLCLERKSCNAVLFHYGPSPRLKTEPVQELLWSTDNPSPQGLWGQQGQVEGAPLQHSRVPGGDPDPPRSHLPAYRSHANGLFHPFSPQTPDQQQLWLPPTNVMKRDTPAQAKVCLTFSDECPSHFCCPIFHSQARVALLWKTLPREGWEEFLEEAKLSNAVSLCHASIWLTLAGNIFNFQTCMTQVGHHYRQGPVFEHFLSRTGFGFCASGVAFISQRGGIGSCFQEFITNTALE